MTKPWDALSKPHIEELRSHWGVAATFRGCKWKHTLLAKDCISSIQHVWFNHFEPYHTLSWFSSKRQPTKIMRPLLKYLIVKYNVNYPRMLNHSFSSSVRVIRIYGTSFFPLSGHPVPQKCRSYARWGWDIEVMRKVQVLSAWRVAITYSLAKKTNMSHAHRCWREVPSC